MFACLLLVPVVVIFLLPILFSLLFYALRIFLLGFFSEVFCNVGRVVVVFVVLCFCSWENCFGVFQNRGFGFFFGS